MEALNKIKTSESDKQILLKRRLEVAKQTLKNHRVGWINLFFTVVFGESFGILIIASDDSNKGRDATGVLILVFILSVFVYFFYFFTKRGKLISNIRVIEYELIESGSEELKENINEDFFTKLVQINFKYIDKYYFQTQEQADKSFRLSAIAAIAGFIIIVLGIAMMYNGKTDPAYITTGAGLISEFIAAVFFYLYNKTILKMSEYHQKLVITQNISIALKITEDL